MPIVLVEEPAGLVSGITGILSEVGKANTFLWGLFSDLLSMIMSNPLIALPVLLAVLTGSVAVVIKVIRKFGVRGKR